MYAPVLQENAALQHRVQELTDNLSSREQSGAVALQSLVSQRDSVIEALKQDNAGLMMQVSNLRDEVQSVTHTMEVCA